MIAIVPARGGSKGLPGKNIKSLNGKPMIAYTIQAALESRYITDVVISTDDEQIYDVAASLGATKTFLRPKELARDDSLAVDNYIYTTNRLSDEFGYDVDNFVVLQPTSPLRESQDIDGAIDLFYKNSADSVVSYCLEYHPVMWHKYIEADSSLTSIFSDDSLNNRQQFRESYFPNGAIFVFKKSLIDNRQYFSEKTFAYKMPRSRSIDIDTQEDFDYAQFLMGKNNETHASL
ncbi:acylneuraminate cytidylyltransferase family protein [Vibrio aestuarianus]|uniref:acylneuraminate cytidylyltransferase family protein n=1 Tax=Vibrio aestuarianus TaxID=28171 RepID=UPI0021C4A435|nr:acylneuraminate cytidylyltransferase family protein [Vibrio aestuarianus]MDE1319352.1 acylneuraminate cytidylyltransferase family protein [Vibrio aestuarianus]CAH8242005.1 N-Acetylneuraminate cytidylyltransferase [Vibrio aestuarianus]